MIFLIMAGVIALVFGIMILVAPDTLRRLEAEANKRLVSFEEKVYTLRAGTGVSFILAAILIFFIAYYISRR